MSAEVPKTSTDLSSQSVEQLKKLCDSLDKKRHRKADTYQAANAVWEILQKKLYDLEDEALDSGKPLRLSTRIVLEHQINAAKIKAEALLKESEDAYMEWSRARGTYVYKYDMEEILLKEPIESLLSRFHKGNLIYLEEPYLGKIKDRLEEFAKEGTSEVHESARLQAEHLTWKIDRLRKRKVEDS